MTIALIDASAIYAMLDANDARNVSAVKRWNDMLDREVALVASSYVISEAIALLHARIGTPAVEAFVNRILPVLTVDWANEDTQAVAIRMLLATKGRNGPSLTDCANIETMQRLGITTIFAYDEHYARPSIRVIG